MAYIAPAPFVRLRSRPFCCCCSSSSSNLLLSALYVAKKVLQRPVQRIRKASHSELGVGPHVNEH